MFRWKKSKLIKSVAQEIAPRLAIKYGKKECYLPEEIDWALGAIGKDSDKQYLNYAYGMLTDHSFYMSLGLISTLGPYQAFQKQVCDVLAVQTSVASIEMYLEHASTKSVNSLGESSPSSDTNGGASIESDFSGS